MKILTCNILNSQFDCEPEFHWSQRGPYCLEQIGDQTPDIFALQECSDEQYADFQAAFPDFDSYGMNCGQQAEGAPTEAIFFRRESLICTDRGGYLLDKDTGCIANWVQLRDGQTGSEFRITNTHLIWGSPEGRLNQLSSIIRETDTVDNNIPQLLTGDMNSVQGGAELSKLFSSGWVDSYASSNGPGRQTGTNHAFCPAERDEQHAKVDWILGKGPWQFTEAGVIRDRREGLPASDHYFVYANCIIQL